MDNEQTVTKSYTSKTKRGECMTADCKNQRRDGAIHSKFCQKCSDDKKKKI